MFTTGSPRTMLYAVTSRREEPAKRYFASAQATRFFVTGRDTESEARKLSGCCPTVSGVTHPPSHDFYAAVAGLTPLLLVTAALEGRRLAGTADTDEPLSIGVLFFAVIGEIAALAGLAGSNVILVPEAAACGTALLALALLGPIALRLLPPKTVGRWRRLPCVLAGLATVMAPLVAAGVYAARLMV